MNFELVGKAKELGVALTRHDLHIIDVKKPGLTVKHFREYLEGLDDAIEFETDYCCDDDYVSYFELYHRVIVDKTEQELQNDVDAAIKRQEIIKQNAERYLDDTRRQELARIQVLELELMTLKKKHGL